MLACALFNRFYDKDDDISVLPLSLKASSIASLISGWAASTYGTESSDLPSSIELELI